MSSSAAEWSVESEEIEMILQRLPAIHLSRCKAVCKGWRSLISSRRFVSAHLKHSKSNPSSHHLLLHSVSRQPSLAPFTSLICYSEILVMVGSVNGLICMARRSSSLSPVSIWILNPDTGLSRQLPSPPVSRLSDLDSLKLAFWCDDDSDGVYTVAKIISKGDGKTKLQVWVSSFPDKWSAVATFQINISSGNTQFTLQPCDVLIEGVAAYWITSCRDIIFILVLDLKTKQLESIPLSKRQMCMPTECPIDIIHNGENSLFGAKWNGNFVLLQNSFCDDGLYDIWTIVNDGNRRWKRSLKICLNFPFDKCIGTAKGKLVLQRFGEILILYNMETGMNDDLTLEGLSLKVACAHDFVGSLVAIEGFVSNNVVLNEIMSVSWPYSYTSEIVPTSINPITQRRRPHTMFAIGPPKLPPRPQWVTLAPVAQPQPFGDQPMHMTKKTWQSQHGSIPPPQMQQFTGMPPPPPPQISRDSWDCFRPLQPSGVAQPQPFGDQPMHMTKKTWQSQHDSIPPPQMQQFTGMPPPPPPQISRDSWDCFRPLQPSGVPLSMQHMTMYQALVRGPPPLVGISAPPPVVWLLPQQLSNQPYAMLNMSTQPFGNGTIPPAFPLQNVYQSPQLGGILPPQMQQFRVMPPPPPPQISRDSWDCFRPLQPSGVPLSMQHMCMYPPQQLKIYIPLPQL